MNAKNGKIRAGIIRIGKYDCGLAVQIEKDCSGSLPGPPKGAV